MKLFTKQILMLLIIGLISLPAIADPAGKAADHQKAMSVNTGTSLYGKVVKTMDANSYTYVQIDTGEKKYWAAGPHTVLKKGSMIAINTQMPFTDFESKTLNKKFKTIYFVSQFTSDQPGQQAPVSDPHANIIKADKVEAVKGIAKATDGKTVAEVFKQKKTLAGKAVLVRGKVMKYTPKVMGKNWLHIQDSSSNKKLVVTTEQKVNKGDLVLANGIIAVDQDLGYGYVYEVILERALISVE